MTTLDKLFEQAAADYAANEEAIVSGRRFVPYLTARIVIDSGIYAQVYDDVQLIFQPEAVLRVSFTSFQYTPANFSGSASIQNFQSHFVGAVLVVTVASLFNPSGIRPVTTDTVTLEASFSGWGRPRTQLLGSFTPEFRDPRLGLGDCPGPCFFDSSTYSGPPAHFCIKSFTLSR